MENTNDTVNAMFGVTQDVKTKEPVKVLDIKDTDKDTDVVLAQAPVENPYFDETKKPIDSRGVVGDGIVDTIEELIDRETNISFFKLNFWDLWLQKVFRNFASMKFQLLILLYIPVIWGMFNFKPGTQEVWISATLGLSFLGGGYVTLAASRYLGKTNLLEKSDNELTIDKNELNTDK